VNEPLVGTPSLRVLVFDRFVGLVPHIMTALHWNVSPMSLAGKTTVSVCPVRFLLAFSVMTGLLTVNPLTPEPSDPVIWTCTKIVSLLLLSTPNFHVWTPPVLEIESLWLQFIWLKLGATHVFGFVLSGHPCCGCTTVTGTVVLCWRLPLTPVTVTE
jgi:hypothetical protein